MMGEFGGMGGWGIFGALHMVLWWALIILGIVVAVKWLIGGTGRDARRGIGALDILKERYARGEIDRDEYEQKRRDIAA